MLENWDFGDSEANGTTAQVNRQKSARNLVVVALGRAVPSGTFLDPKKKQTSIATLQQCDCHDFSFAGRSPRKSFKPCMHIYRLAMELGLMEAKHDDHAMREARERQEVTLLKEVEDDRLRALPHDSGEWGGWSSAVHESGLQRNRQYRAYFILDDEPDEIVRAGTGWDLHGYRVTLEDCECMDFVDRRLPCKHIYAVALASRVSIPLTRDEYQAAHARGLEIVFAFRGDP